MCAGTQHARSKYVPRSLQLAKMGFDNNRTACGFSSYIIIAGCGVSLVTCFTETELTHTRRKTHVVVSGNVCGRDILLFVYRFACRNLLLTH